MLIYFTVVKAKREEKSQTGEFKGGREAEYLATRQEKPLKTNATGEVLLSLFTEYNKKNNVISKMYIWDSMCKTHCRTNDENKRKERKLVFMICTI